MQLFYEADSKQPILKLCLINAQVFTKKITLKMQNPKIFSDKCKERPLFVSYIISHLQQVRCI